MIHKANPICFNTETLPKCRKHFSSIFEGANFPSVRMDLKEFPVPCYYLILHLKNLHFRKQFNFAGRLEK